MNRQSADDFLSSEHAFEVLAAQMQAYDPYTVGHQKRVASIAVSLARYLGWSNDRIRNLYLAAMLHDIGKMTLSTEILSKLTPLTNYEMQMIRGHAEAGYQFLKHIPGPVAEIVRQHHERIDGSGYPRGLKDQVICEEAKVIAVADTFEAIANARSYRPAKGLDEALNEIKAQAGIALDKSIVEAVFELVANDHQLENIIGIQL